MVVDTDSHSPGDLITGERAVEIAMGAGLTREEALDVVNRHAIIR
jgi:histidinol phosphatase-like PHP family hydrolase